MDSNNNDVRLVGRKSNMPLLIVIAVVALALLGYMLWKSMNMTDVAPTAATSTPQEQQADAQDDMADDIKDIAGIYAVTDTKELNNKNVDLDEVTVASVISDRLFYVTQGTSTSQQLLVHLDSDLDDGDEEQQVKIVAGQKLDLEGELKDVSQQDIEAGDDYTAAEVTAAKTQRVFLNATDVDTK